jgi:hypothetical protein
MLERPTPPATAKPNNESVEALREEIKKLHHELYTVRSLLYGMQEEFSRLKQEKR